ncbi:MAG: DUF116 domain-containing protein [Candidatus Altiarchaeales archaeon]|nr:DUF116 domain-containing protein [Candidatus Altiarchaeales archaeon]
MDLIPTEVLTYIGIITILLIATFTVLLILALVMVYLILRNGNIIDKLSSGASSIILRILLFILDIMYIPSKGIISLMRGDENTIDRVCTDIRNILLRGKFMDVPYKDRIVILPQCLRNINCKTTFSSVEGSQCLRCRKCKIFDIVTKAEELGYMGCYIAPGGGFVRRIIKKMKPKAVVGLGCPYEVNMGLLEVSGKGIAVQGVILLKSGCVETDVDLEDVFNILELRSEDGK